MFKHDCQEHRLNVGVGLELWRTNYTTITGNNFTMNGVGMDIYRTTPKDWGLTLLIRTGSIEHNKMLCARAIRMGMQLKVSEGLIKDGKIIASETEEGHIQISWDEMDPS